MSDLHAQLLEIARDHEINGDTPAAGMLGAALRAVVELHAPYAESPWACGHCSTLEIPYPCSTIRAIARELGVAP